MGVQARLARIEVASLEELTRHPNPKWVIEGGLRSGENDDPADPHLRVDLDESWHPLHWLLNGNTWDGKTPLERAILVGEDIGQDVGLDWIGYLDPAQVAEVAQALAAFPEDTLIARYDAAAMDADKVFGGGWHRESGTELTHLLRHFRALCAFYADAAARGGSVVKSFG